VVSYTLQPQRGAAPKFVQRGATAQKHSQRCVRFTAEDLRATQWHIQLAAARLSDPAEAVWVHVTTFDRGHPPLWDRFRRDGPESCGCESTSLEARPLFAASARARCPSTYFSTCRGPAQWPPAAGPRSRRLAPPCIAESPRPLPALSAVLMADDTQRRTCACCQKKAKDGGVDGERIPLDQALCGGCRGKRCLGRCGRKLEAGDVLNTCRTCAASVADADIKGAAGKAGRGLLRCLIEQARGSEDKKFQITGMRKAFIASINGFDPARNAQLLKGDELILYRASMAWLHLKDKASYNHIRERLPYGQGHEHRKSKTTELGLVRGCDINLGTSAGPPLLQTQNRRFDGDEPDAEAAEAAGDAVAEEYDALRNSTSPKSTAVEDARRLGAVRRCEQAAAGALRSGYPRTRRRAEDVARGAAAAAQVTYTSRQERDIRDQSRTPAEREASEAKSQWNKAYKENPDSVRNSVRDGSSTVGEVNSKRKKESDRFAILRRRKKGEFRDGDYVPVDRSREESVGLWSESRARQRAGEGAWFQCTYCKITFSSVREEIRCPQCRSDNNLEPALKPESSSSEEEEDDVVVVKVEPGGVYPGTVSERPPGCALVKLECGDQGSLAHGNCETGRLPVLNAKVHVRVLRIENNGRKIVLSTKNINQETGKPTIASDAAGEPVCQGKLDESDWGRSTASRPRKGGRVVLREGLGDADGFTDIELAKVFVVNKTRPGNVLNDLFCATRDGTRLRGIPAIRKYLKVQRDACKAKPRHVESDGLAEGSDMDDGEEEEEARLQGALAMSMEEEPASLG
jgi:hypothetical protein